MLNIRKSVFRPASTIGRIYSSGLVLAALLSGARAVAQTQYNATIFGSNVYVIDPSLNGAALAAQLNKLNTETEFSPNRYAVLFKPGSYNFGSTQISAEGFYESIAGLGTTPDQVSFAGNFDVGQADSNGNGTDNFWRSQENMEVAPNGEGYWGVSQGASYRRMHVNGNLQLTNYQCGYASGGFISNTLVSGQLYSCSEQQYYTRNSQIGSWKGSNWNMVFSGVVNAPAQDFGNGGNSFTTLPSTPQSREKPFLYLDGSGNYQVFVPALKTASSGYDWAGGLGSGTSLPISTFFIATPSSGVAAINSALASGKNLILTPGIYSLSGTIKVPNANTVVLGLGYATLVPGGAYPAISTSDVDGVIIADIIVDAPPGGAPVLVEVGGTTGTTVSHTSNPPQLDDVFIRIGGYAAGQATTAIQVDANNTIMDNIWSWRADHGADATWTGNTAAHGLVVNGNNVLATGLAVEHYQQSQVVWNGNNGETIFYQSELPYDPPSQAAWMNGSARGYPAYQVTGCGHTAYGLGVYSYFNQGVSIFDDNAILTPNTTGINMTDMVTVFLTGSGGIANIINNTGGIVQSGSKPDYLKSYVGNGTCPTTTTPPATTSVAINAGGGAVGNFLADQDFSGGGAASTSSTIDVTGVTNPAPQAVYQSNRAGVLTYTIPGFTSGSTHTVRLDFAELYWSNAGQRVFNVAINGPIVLPNFDIVKAAGKNYKAVTETFTTTANSAGQIVISLTNASPQVDQPEISGIEIQ